MCLHKSRQRGWSLQDIFEYWKQFNFLSVRNTEMHVYRTQDAGRKSWWILSKQVKWSERGRMKDILIKSTEEGLEYPEGAPRAGRCPHDGGKSGWRDGQKALTAERDRIRLDVTAWELVIYWWWGTASEKELKRTPRFGTWGLGGCGAIHRHGNKKGRGWSQWENDFFLNIWIKDARGPPSEVI